MRPYFEDGGIVIYHGDCREVLPQIEAVDHAITDPPYMADVYLRMNALRSHVGSGTLKRLGLMDGGAIAQMAAGAIGSVDELIQPISAELARLVRRWALVFSCVESCHIWRDALKTAGMRYARTGIWVKPDAMPQMSGDRPGVGFEPCTIVHRDMPMRWNGGGHAAVWEYGTVKINRPNHPCPKPEPLMAELVTLFTDPGDLILDPFAGSGTTAVAAKRLGRRCILIEQEEKYCEIAARRLSQGALDLFATASTSSRPADTGSLFSEPPI